MPQGCLPHSWGQRDRLVCRPEVKSYVTDVQSVPPTSTNQLYPDNHPCITTLLSKARRVAHLVTTAVCASATRRSSENSAQWQSRSSTLMAAGSRSSERSVTVPAAVIVGAVTGVVWGCAALSLAWELVLAASGPVSPADCRAALAAAVGAWLPGACAAAAACHRRRAVRRTVVGGTPRTAVHAASARHSSLCPRFQSRFCAAALL